MRSTHRRGATAPTAILLAVTLSWLAACTARLGSGDESPAADAQIGGDPDAAVVDAQVPDAQGIPDATPLLSCDDAYGAAPSYTLCPLLTTENTCAFSVATNDAPCAEVCPLYGGTCVRAYDNPVAPEQCSVIEPNLDTCLTEGRGTEICECTRVPVDPGQ